MRHTSTMTSTGMRVLVMLGILGFVTGGTGSAQDRLETVDWPLHNLDLAGSRFSPLEQIDRSNVHTLTPRWLFQHGVIDGVSNQTTPVIVDGVMYVTDSRGSVYAVDGSDGHLLWSYDVTELLGGGRREGYIFRHRGVTYADGVVYSAAGSFIFALDAETGEPIDGFGDNGQASVILDVLRLRYPDVETAISMGYWFTSAPQISRWRPLRGVDSQREPYSRVGMYSRSMRRRVRSSGTSIRFHRTRMIRGLILLGRHGLEANAMVAEFGKPRRSIRSLGWCMSRLAIRSATVQNAPG